MNELTIADIVRDFSKKYKNLTNSELKSKIIENYPDFNQDSVRRTISKLRNDEEIHINSNKKVKNYFVSDGRYFFETPHGKFDLSVESIDKLFYEYSEHGLNYTQNQILRKYNLEIWQWNAIKSQLWLFKKSHIFSPYTVDNTPKEDLGNMIEEKMDHLFKDIGHQVEEKYYKSLYKRYLEVIKEHEQKNNYINRIISELYDSLNEVQVQPVVLRSEEGDNSIINVFIADIHFGLVNNEKHITEYSIKIVEEKLNEIAFLVNNANANTVNLFFLGDMIESFSGLNHLDSWKSLDREGYGSKVVINCYKTLIEFINKIANVKNIYGISGNHDRASSSNKEDTHGFIAEIIFEFIKVSYMNKINVVYDSMLISQSFDDINYIITHGHHNISKLNAAEIILKYGEPYMFNVVVQAHWHERRIKKDTEKFRDLVCPSVMPGNRYSVTSGYSTNPGFLIVKNNGKGKPIVLDYAL